MDGVEGINDFLNKYLEDKIPVIGVVTDSNNGLMSKEMFVKFKSLEVHEVATVLKDGLMSKDDRIQMNKLNAESLEINSPNGTAFLITVGNDGKLLVNKKEVN